MNRDGIKSQSAPRHARVLIAKNRVTGGIYADQLRQTLCCDAVDKCIVDEVIERRILVNAPAEGTIETLIHLKIPDFGGGFRIQIQLVLTRGGIATLLSWWHLEGAVLSVIKHQDILIIGNRDSVLPDRRQATRRKRQRISS